MFPSSHTHTWFHAAHENVSRVYMPYSVFSGYSRNPDTVGRNGQAVHRKWANWSWACADRQSLCAGSRCMYVRQRRFSPAEWNNLSPVGRRGECGATRRAKNYITPTAETPTSCQCKYIFGSAGDRDTYIIQPPACSVPLYSVYQLSTRCFVFETFI